jgi:hypothetical protein
MKGVKKMTKTSDVNMKEFHLAKGESLLPENFPELINLSAGFMFNFIPKPSHTLPPEFVYVPINPNKQWDKSSLKVTLAITEWNSLWEAGHLRSEFVPKILTHDFPKELRWLTKIENANLYLIPNGRKSAFDAFEPLYHLLPLHTLNRFGLPAFKPGFWPPRTYHHTIDQHFTDDFDERVAKAFASYLWPWLDSGSRLHSFSKDDPIVLLAHNLNFWLPCIYKVAEERLQCFHRVEFDNKKQMHAMQKIQTSLPSDIQVNRPLKGGSIWYGEEDARQATKELIQVADKDGKLRAILEAVRSNRVKDDFSNLWSYAKEDFERKIYHKRSKVRVSFVQLDEAKPVHAPTSELHGNLLWEDFIALLDRKERRIVVCLKNGTTRVSEISKRLGYANHSPVCKALKRIRDKAKKYLYL